MVRGLRQVAIAIVAAAMPFGAEAQNIVPRDTARGATVTNRARPDFDPLGIRLGNFRLDGAVEVGAGYDSNLFGRNRNTKSSGFATEAGSLAINSDWTQHAMGASVSTASRQYFSQGSLDWTDYNAGGFGRYDFSADTKLEAQYRHYREHLDVFNFDVQSTRSIVQPVPYESDEFQVTGSTRFNRFGALATGVYRTYRFEDVLFNNIRTRVSQQSFNSAIGAVGGSYALADGRSITAVVRLQDINYTNSISSNRDSFTYEALIGFQYDFDGVWQGRMAVGWRHRDYRGPNIKPLEGIAAEGALSWQPTQLTSVALSVSRTIEESIRRDAVSFNRTTAGVRVDHEIRRNIILTGDVRLDNRSYQSPNQSATDALFTVGPRWLINRNLSLTAAYSHARRLQSSGGLEEYSRNVLELRLRVAI